MVPHFRRAWRKFSDGLCSQMGSVQRMLILNFNCLPSVASVGMDGGIPIALNIFKIDMISREY
jgi:hypothetical protein